MNGGRCGLFPTLEQCREERRQAQKQKLKEHAKVAFTDAQEERIREIIREVANASFERTMDAHRHVATKHKGSEA